jgi:hypothetical protein
LSGIAAKASTGTFAHWRMMAKPRGPIGGPSYLESDWEI